MKYDILEPYKEFLYDQLTANTARKYYSCMVKLLQGVEINRVEELSLEYLQKELPQRFRTKNEFSAAKNALRLFGECYPQLQMPAKEYFKEESLKKRNYTKKPGKTGKETQEGTYGGRTETAGRTEKEDKEPGGSHFHTPWHLHPYAPVDLWCGTE